MCNSHRIGAPSGWIVSAIMILGLTVQGRFAQASEARVDGFFIAAFDVEGVKLIDQVDVEAAVYPFLGPKRTRTDIDHAVEVLQKTYLARGYQTVVVTFPQQTVSLSGDNIVRLRVTETPVGRLRVTGSRYYSPDAIRAAAPALREGQAPDISLATQEIAEINRLPGRRVEPVLHAGKAPGTVDVDLKVTDTPPLHASVELTNDHNQNTDPLRLTGTVRYDNLWQLGHSASFTYAVAPTNRGQSEIFAGSYLAPLRNTPVSLLAFGYISNSNVATLGGTNVLGKGYAIGTQAILQLPRRGDVSQSVSFGLDFKNFDEAINFSNTVSADAIHYWPVNAVYNFQRDGGKSSTKASLGLTAGLSGLGSDTAAFNNKRADARPNFVHINLDITQSETLWRGFQATQRLSGQATDQPLVSSEQFSSGGLTSVRGYLQSEAVADEGVSGTVELATPSLAPKFLARKVAGLVDDLRLYVFADGAALWVLRPQHGQTQFFSQSSVGVGLRTELLRHLTAEVALAVPLISGPVTHAERSRATFSLKSDF